MTVRPLLLGITLALFLGTPVSAAAKKTPAKKAAAGPSSTGPVTPNDCSLALRFKGKRPSAHTCTSKEFYSDPRNPSSQTAQQVCLGFEGPINAKLVGSLHFCKRLTSKTWSVEMNMRFLQCAAQGKLGRVVWLTKASALSKTRPDWQNAVTFAEMCYWDQLGKVWPK